MELIELAAKLGEASLKQHEADRRALKKAAKLIQKRAQAKLGEYQEAAPPFAGWADLAEYTKSDRVAQGFPEDEPLLRTGAMRDSIEYVVLEGEAQVGSNSDIAVYQELGTEKIPPRSFLGGAAAESVDDIIVIVGDESMMALTGRGVHNGRIEIEHD